MRSIICSVFLTGALTAPALADQAKIVEGEVINDPRAFARRLQAVMESGLKAKT